MVSPTPRRDSWNAQRGCVVDGAVTDRGARSSLPEQQAAERRIETQRSSAELRIESLTRQIDAIVESSGWTATDDEHDPEGATIAFERAQLLALLAQARADLHDLDRAAERLHRGEYHRCERCGQRIGEQRITALPATRVCITCATATRR